MADLPRKLSALSFALAVAASLALCVFPFYSPAGTILQVSGPRALVGLSMPVLAAVPAIAFPRRWIRAVAAGLLSALVLAGAFSIGFFYLPSAVLMAAAALAGGRAR